MMVNTDYLVPMTEANQNFSRAVRTVDESGLAVILKNNKPRYVVVDFDHKTVDIFMIKVNPAQMVYPSNNIIKLFDAPTISAG